MSYIALEQCQVVVSINPTRWWWVRTPPRWWSVRAVLGCRTQQNKNINCTHFRINDGLAFHYCTRGGSDMLCCSSCKIVFQRLQVDQDFHPHRELLPDNWAVCVCPPLPPHYWGLPSWSRFQKNEMSLVTIWLVDCKTVSNDKTLYKIIRYLNIL